MISFNKTFSFSSSWAVFFSFSLSAISNLEKLMFLFYHIQVQKFLVFMYEKKFPVFHISYDMESIFRNRLICHTLKDSKLFV